MGYSIYLTNGSGTSEVTVPIWLPGSSLESCQLISATLNEELNKAAVLTITMPPTNAGYASVVPMTSTVTVYDGEEVIFRGRPIRITNDFYNCKKIVCEGPVAWLNDGIMRPFSTDSMADMINRIRGIGYDGYNTQASPNRKIAIYSENYSGSFEASSNEYETFLATINEFVLPAFGDDGWMRVTYSDTLYGDAKCAITMTNVSPVSGQEIRFGKNLLDLESCIDPTDLYTVLIPLGKDVEQIDPDTGEVIIDPDTGTAITAPLTIESVEPNGRDWIQNSAAVASFGRITTTVRYPDIEDAAELYAAAQADLTAHSAVVNRLDISAVDLRRAGVSVDALRVGYLSAVSSPHGVSGTYRCMKISADLMSPGKTRYQFGAAGKLFSAAQVIAQAEQARRTALAAKEAATAKGTAIAAGSAAKNAQDGVDALNEEIGDPTDTATSGGGGSSGSGSGGSTGGGSDPTLWARANQAYTLAQSAQDTADGAIAAIPAGATQAPLMDGTAAVGSSEKWAREDHVHPTDTTRAAANDIPTAISQLTNDSGFITLADIPAASSNEAGLMSAADKDKLDELYPDEHGRFLIAKSSSETVTLTAYRAYLVACPYKIWAVFTGSSSSTPTIVQIAAGASNSTLTLTAAANRKLTMGNSSASSGFYFQVTSLIHN